MDVKNLHNRDVLRHKWDFIDPPQNEYICGYCKEVMRMPMLTECCGNHFCAPCIEKSYGNEYECPKCEQDNITAILDKQKWGKILELDVKCPFTNRGCLWTGELRARGAHLDSSNGDCEYLRTVCVNGCGEKLEKNEVEEHLELLCPYRLVTCPHCNEKDKKEVITGQHKSECSQLPVDCPNSCGERDIKKMYLQQHFAECPKVVVECDFQCAGCTNQVERGNLLEHLKEDAQTHLSLVTRLFAEEIEKKDEEIVQLVKKQEINFKRLRELHTHQLKNKDRIIQELKDQSEKHFKDYKKLIEQRLEKITNNFVARSKNLESNSKKLDDVPVQQDTNLLLTSILHSKSTREIWKGTYNDKEVVIKKEHLSTGSTKHILVEADILKNLKHENIVQLYDLFVTEETVCMILELVPNGNLQNYVRTNPLLLHQHVLICKQVALGLDYLQQKLCMHRKIQATNVLVGENVTCKLSDFGSAVKLDDYEQTVSTQGFRAPIKWCAPETFIEQYQSLKSDVWSYGMLIWEVITGKEPFSDSTNDSAIQRIKTGLLMPRPENCPETFYDIMLGCWKQEPLTRLAFEAVADLLDHVKDSHKYTNTH